MQKLIIAVLMVVMFATPCLAQEIEPDELSGLHGTVWRKIGVWKTNIDNSDEFFGIERGFYAGRAYGLEDQVCAHYNDYYHDVLTVSFYKYGSTWFGDYISFAIEEEGILFPFIGIGFVEVSEYLAECDFSSCADGWYDPYYILLRKVNNWWDPYQECPNLMSR